MAASIEVRNITTNSFEARVIGLPIGYAKYVHWFLNNKEQDVIGLKPADDETKWLEFTGLSPNTSYTLLIVVKKLDETQVGGLREEITTKAKEEDEDAEWSTVRVDLSTLSVNTEKTRFIDSYETLRLKMSFANKGTAIFSSKNASGAYGYLSISTSFNETNGKPTESLRGGYSNKGDFSFEYEVSSGTIYYLYVRHYDDTDSGDISVVIEPPEGASSDRPDEFKWQDGTQEKESGKPFDITAEEWGNLLDNINAVREYKEYPKIGTTTTPNSEIEKFYYPKSNDTFYATYYNQCLHAFKTMGIIADTQYKEYTVEPKDPITADAINFLVKTINSVE